uniref:Uncharacterized protein n=1 Tax=Timema monikensis TaxID=170555 RepID=A0A7R9EKJ2_9NEOP|nr:unnamed protein product [Timema monikensis]
MMPLGVSLQELKNVAVLRAFVVNSNIVCALRGACWPYCFTSKHLQLVEPFVFWDILTMDQTERLSTIGPAAAILVITQIGCDAPAIIALLAIITFCSGAFVGGSMLNYMDLAINFVPALSGFSATVTGLIVEEQIWNKPINPKDERNIPDKEDKHHTVLTVESDDSKVNKKDTIQLPNSLRRLSRARLA